MGNNRCWSPTLWDIHPILLSENINTRREGSRNGLDENQMPNREGRKRALKGCRTRARKDTHTHAGTHRTRVIFRTPSPKKTPPKRPSPRAKKTEILDSCLIALCLYVPSRIQDSKVHVFLFIYGHVCWASSAGFDVFRRKRTWMSVPSTVSRQPPWSSVNTAVSSWDCDPAAQTMCIRMLRQFKST